MKRHPLYYLAYPFVFIGVAVGHILDKIVGYSPRQEKRDGEPQP